MAPVPASKKYWIFDGSVAQYASALSSGSVHMGQSCTDCHGGDANQNARAQAHVSGFEAIAGADNCSQCHGAIATSAAAGLHTTLGGYTYILAQRGFGDVSPAEAMARFEKQCTKCHTANSADQVACGFCHVSVPNTAGGGLLAGHAFQQTPSMDNNCTACHGSRVKDEFYGRNNELLERNKAAFAAGSPWKDETYALEADVHKAAGLTCVSCHAEGEMHGQGHPAADTGDRYDVTTSPACLDCHGPGQSDATAFAAVTLHMSGHLAAMDCQVCHAQPYKNCFGCHTDVTEGGLGFYKINQGDPTLADRKAAASDPSTVAPDALMTFRVGPNPRFGEAGQKQYTVLRHVPVDTDVFTYTGANAVSDLIPAVDSGLTPNMGSLATWKHATPHTIKRQTPITSACTNCHATPPTLAPSPTFWLTDPVGNAEGWVQSAYDAGERAANAGIAMAPAGAPTLLPAATLQDWIDAGYVNGTGANRVVVLDARKATTAGGYIPGAQLWDVANQVQNRVDGPALAVNEVLDGASMDDMLSSHGIDADTTIVITSAETASYFPSRAYFLFRYWGFPKSRIKVLDGYNAGWDAAALVADPTAVTPTTYSVKDLASFSPDQRAGLSEMMAMVAAGTGIAVDMRGDKTAAGSTPGVFSDVAGDVVVFEGTPKGGTSFSYADFQVGGGDLHFKTPAEIRAALEAAGIDGTKTVLSYCRTAYIASTGYFVLDGILGWPVQVFDGSWSLWGKLSDDAAEGGELPAGSAWAVDNTTYMDLVVYNAEADSDPATDGVQPYVIETLQLDAAGEALDPTTAAANQVEVEDAAYVGATSGGTDPGTGGTDPGTGGSGGGC